MNTSPGTAADWLIGAFKRNPESFLLMAAGAVLLMRQGGGGAQAQAVASHAVSSGPSAAADLRGYAADVTDRTARSVNSMASAASDYATQTTRKVGEQSGRMVQQAQSTLRDGITRVVNEQPLVVAMAGLAAGAALASVLRPTEFEKDALRPLGEQAFEAATHVGGQLKEATVTAGETLKKAADQRGLNVEGLKDVASEVAGAFKGSFARAGEAGNSQASRPTPRTSTTTNEP